MMKIANEGMKRWNFHLKKELNKITKKKEKSSTIEKDFDKHGNKVSMYEAVKEVYEETIIKGNITFLTRYHTTSLQ